jgi:hypothetical protein
VLRGLMPIGLAVSILMSLAPPAGVRLRFDVAIGMLDCRLRLSRRSSEPERPEVRLISARACRRLPPDDLMRSGEIASRVDVYAV